MSFALSFLLTAIGIVSLWQTHKNMLNIEIDLHKAKPVYCNEYLELNFNIINPHPFYHYSIGIQYQQTAPVYCTLKPNSKQQVTLNLSTQKRGEFQLDGITFFSRFPTGLFHCWSWLQFKQNITIYPKPVHVRLNDATGDANDDGYHHIKQNDGDDFAGLREFKPGESLKHISWKAYAQGKGKLTKTYQGQTQPDLWLDWNLIQASSPEEKISKLTSLVNKAHQNNQRYGLKTPQFVIPQADGAQHKHQCLHALACFQQPQKSLFYARTQ